MITWLIIYVLVGVVNYLIFLTEGKAMATDARCSAPEILAEAGFFVFAWPVQFIFATLVAVNSATDWLLGKLMG